MYILLAIFYFLLIFSTANHAVAVLLIAVNAKDLQFVSIRLYIS